MLRGTSGCPVTLGTQHSPAPGAGSATQARSGATPSTTAAAWSAATKATTVPPNSQATVNYMGVESLTLNGGSGSDVYNVESTAATTPVTINAGANADMFQLSPTTNDLTNVAGRVTANGGGGFDLGASFGTRACSRVFLITPQRSGTGWRACA